MIIEHRINTIGELKNVDKSNGIEVDIRYDSSVKDVVLTHDINFTHNNTLNDFLHYYNHALIIFNIKSSLCEEYCIRLMEKFNIKNYLFLDSQIPDIIKYAKLGYGDKFITRISKFETYNKNLVSLASKYIWVDTFGEADISFINQNDNHDYIFVSPELHKKDENIVILKEMIKQKFDVYHVCTDFKNYWT